MINACNELVSKALPGATDSGFGGRMRSSTLANGTRSVGQP